MKDSLKQIGAAVVCHGNAVKVNRILGSVFLVLFMMLAVMTVSAQTKKKLPVRSAQKKVQSVEKKGRTVSAARKPVNAGQKAAQAVEKTPAPIKAAPSVVRDTAAKAVIHESVVEVKNGQVDSPEDGYRFAVGLRLFWGIGFTAKYFLRPEHAIEGIVKIRSYRGVGTDIGIAGVYQYHRPLKGVEGLNWYAGGGAFGGFFSFSRDISRSTDYGNEGYFGILGTIGLEYRLKDLPLAISADWQPSLTFVDFYGGSGLGAENGGLGIKYTF